MLLIIKAFLIYSCILDYERRSGGGNYNKSGQNRGGRVQGGWNQDSNYNQGGYNNRGQGGRKY